MDTRQAILTRKSVRTFDRRQLDTQDRTKLEAFIADVENPYDIPVEFALLDAEKYGLSSPVIEGEGLYLAAKVRKGPNCEEAFGYSFEKVVLYAWELGIGTTWMGGTLDRAVFEAALGVGTDERMYAVTPLGYPASSKSQTDSDLRATVGADDRKPASELFFDGDFSKPLAANDDAAELLEVVRWAPSASNQQPWRIVKAGDRFHLYERHTPGYALESYGDVQKVDLGIALCHLMGATGGRLEIADPGTETPEGVEYVATVAV